jgi:hypothetical protein
VTFGPRYGPQPQNNLTVKDIISSAEFAPAVMKAIQSPSLRGYTVKRSIPQRALDVPVGTVLPRVAEDKDEFFLIVDSASNIIHHYRYRAAVAAWEFVGDKRQQIVTALPTTDLYEGLGIIYDTGTSGVRWNFVYDTTDGSTYPWLFVGGPPLYAEVLTAQTETSTTYDDLTTSGPAITLPVAGDYDVGIGCDGWNSAPGEAAYMSYAIGASAADDTDAVIHREVTLDSLSPTSLWRSRRKTGLTAVTLTAKYRVSNGTGAFQNRAIIATPVRVG